jgi:lipopolysaccharide/colanic/teichoic acid biosynthesis glycosyltransferase
MTVHTSHSIKVENFLSEPAMIVSRIPSNQKALVIKSIIDYLFAVFVIIVTFPLFLMLPPLIKLVSPGPVFYRQIRSGQYGRKFYLIKFRSMVMDAEKMQDTLIDMNEAQGPVFKIKDDPRIIPMIGKFMRKFGIDEIPQFINVIRGEMSVVGPRPPMPSEVKKYELWQRRRLSMKPGITCTWQIQPDRNNILFDQWMNLDLEYIDNWSLWKDVVIILKTIPSVLFGYGR